MQPRLAGPHFPAKLHNPLVVDRVLIARLVLIQLAESRKEQTEASNWKKIELLNSAKGSKQQEVDYWQCAWWYHRLISSQQHLPLAGGSSHPSDIRDQAAASSRLIITSGYSTSKTSKTSPFDIPLNSPRHHTPTAFLFSSSHRRVKGVSQAGIVDVC